MCCKNGMEAAIFFLPEAPSSQAGRCIIMLQLVEIFKSYAKPITLTFGVFVSLPFASASEWLPSEPVINTDVRISLGESTNASVSQNGEFVVFRSCASNMSDIDQGSRRCDIYRRNLLTGNVDIVSAHNENIQEISNNGSTNPRISGDGRFVVFQSHANDLLESLATEREDVYIWDSLTGTIELISVGTDGVAGNRQSFSPDVSDDGNLVVFVSKSGSFDSSISSRSRVDNIYLRNRSTGETKLITTTNDGPSTGDSINPRISADGKFIVFESRENNLVSSDSNIAGSDIFRYNVDTNEIELVSLDSQDEQLTTGENTWPAISDDGSVVAFISDSSLNSNDLDTQRDVYVRNITVGTTQIVSVTSAGENDAGSACDGILDISGDGTKVVFCYVDSQGTFDNYNFDNENVYIRSLQELTTTLVSEHIGLNVSRLGTATNPAISGDGSIVTFETDSSDFNTNDRDSYKDIMGLYLSDSTILRVSEPKSSGSRADVSGVGFSNNGRFVVFKTDDQLLTLLDNSSHDELFVYDRELGVLEQLRLGLGGEDVNDFYGNDLSISEDGNIIAFTSTASNIHSDVTNNIQQVYRYERDSATLTLASVGPNGLAGDNSSIEPSMSHNGRFIAFSSRADNLVDDTNNIAGSDRHVYLFDNLSGEVVLVSKLASEADTNQGTSRFPEVSANGKFVVYQSTNPGIWGLSGSFGDYQISLYGIDQQQNTLVSVDANGELGNGPSYFPDVSSDGEVLLYLSEASNLIDSFGSSTEPVLIRQLVATGEKLAVNLDNEGNLLLVDELPAISADGNYITYNYDSSSDSSGVAAFDVNGMMTSIINDNVGIVFDILFSPEISADGSLILYASSNNDLGLLGESEYFSQAYIAKTDSDDDGLPNAWELEFGFDPYYAHSITADFDEDGLSDYQEFELGTSPTDSDSDGDGYADGYDEFPTDSTEWQDTDGDGTGNNAEPAVRADVDGDRRADIVWRNASDSKGWNFLWAMHGEELGESLPINVIQGVNWQLSLGDFNGDGMSDFFLRDPTQHGGMNFLTTMNGSQVVSHDRLPTVSPIFELEVIGDLDGDGIDDVIWQNTESRSIAFWLMNGTTRQYYLSSFLGDRIIEGIDDFNADAKKELVIRDGTQIKLWSYDPEAQTMTETDTGGVTTNDWTLAGTGDLNGDGTADLIWRNIVDGRNNVYFMNAGVVESVEYLSAVDIEWELAKVEDFNGDGKVDFFWRSEAQGGKHIIHLMDGVDRIAVGDVKAVSGSWFIAD